MKVTLIPSDFKSWKRKNELTLSLQHGKYFLCFSYRKLNKNLKQTRLSANGTIDKTPRTIALDPGCRKFLTYYDSLGNAGFIGQGVYKEYKPLLAIRDNAAKKLRKMKKRPKLERLLPTNTAEQKRVRKRVKRRHRLTLLKWAKRYRKYQNKLENTSKDAHYKICNWLLSEYDHVILPRFNVSWMARRKSGLSKATRKGMLQLRHFMFRQRLIQKASSYRGVKLYIGGEMYTSQTCGKCGTRNRKLGSAEVFTCKDKKCDYTTDRDVNAARNILILYGKPLANQKQK